VATTAPAAAGAVQAAAAAASRSQHTSHQPLVEYPFGVSPPMARDAAAQGLSQLLFLAAIAADVTALVVSGKGGGSVSVGRLGGRTTRA
jgi:hypothetical protein